MIKKLLLIAVLLVFSPVVNAATYWVDDNGGASWANCDGETPLSGASACSIATALANADDDDIINFRAGTYVAPTVTPSGDGNRPSFYPTNSGSSGHIITFQRYTNEVVIFDNSANAGSSSTVPTFGTYGQNYITFDGFQAAGEKDAGGIAKAATSDGSSYVTYKNCQLSGAATGTSNTASIRIENCDHITIYNNYLFDNGRSGDQATGVNPSGVEIYDSDYIDIIQNTVTNSVTGFYLKDNIAHVTVERNFISGNMINGILENSKGPDCEYNIVRYNVINVITLAFGDVDQNGSAGGHSYSLTISNNTIRSADQGIKFDPGSEVLWSIDMDTYNNIVVMTATNKDYIRVPAAAMMNNPVINNNIFYGGSGNIFEIAFTEYTDLSAWKTATASHTVAAGGFDENSTIDDPEFDPDDGVLDYDEPEDVKLGGSSPALGAGRAGADIGAWVTGVTQIGYSGDGPPPEDPTAPTTIRGIVRSGYVAN